MSVDDFRAFKSSVEGMPGSLPPLEEGDSWLQILEKQSEAPPMTYRAWRRIVPARFYLGPSVRTLGPEG